jgi:hypothetical protein
MKGIYLTQEGKEEIEAKIAQLEKYKDSDQCNDPRDWSFVVGRQFALSEILSSAIILPVEESWGYVFSAADEVEGQNLFNDCFHVAFPKGVIIKPKES